MATAVPFTRVLVTSRRLHWLVPWRPLAPAASQIVVHALVAVDRQPQTRDDLRLDAKPSRRVRGEPRLERCRHLDEVLGALALHGAIAGLGAKAALAADRSDRIHACRAIRRADHFVVALPRDREVGRCIALAAGVSAPAPGADALREVAAGHLQHRVFRVAYRQEPAHDVGARAAGK